MDALKCWSLVPVGDKEKVDRLQSLIDEKNLSKDDLLLIIQSVGIKELDKEEIAFILACENYTKGSKY